MTTPSEPLRRRTGITLMLCSMVLGLGGCTPVHVAGWQKKHLARDDMQLDRSPLVRQFALQASEAREAASGGRGVGGGGCGCN